MNFPPIRALQEGQSLEPGIYTMTAEEYHDDPTPGKRALSSSLAHLLIEKSRLHAACRRGLLEAEEGEEEPEDEEEKSSPRLELGTLVHTLALGIGRPVSVLDYPDFRTKAARADRDAAAAAGHTPVLRSAYEKAQAMVEELERQGLGFRQREGIAEAVLIWQEPCGIWCRAMLDWLEIADGKAIIRDFKTVYNAQAEKLGRHSIDHGYDIQAAFYRRGLCRLMPELGGRILWRNVWQEITPPFAAVETRFSPSTLAMGDSKVAHAIGAWAEGLETGHWPGYQGGEIEAPEYAKTMWEWHRITCDAYKGGADDYANARIREVEEEEAENEI